MGLWTVAVRSAAIHRNFAQTCSDKLRLSHFVQRSVCKACGKRGAEVRLRLEPKGSGLAASQMRSRDGGYELE